MVPGEDSEVVPGAAAVEAVEPRLCWHTRVAPVLDAGTGVCVYVYYLLSRCPRGQQPYQLPLI